MLIDTTIVDEEKVEAGIDENLPENATTWK